MARGMREPLRAECPRFLSGAWGCGPTAWMIYWNKCTWIISYFFGASSHRKAHSVVCDWSDNAENQNKWDGIFISGNLLKFLDVRKTPLCRIPKRCQCRDCDGSTTTQVLDWYNGKSQQSKAYDEHILLCLVNSLVSNTFGGGIKWVRGRIELTLWC